MIVETNWLHDFLSGEKPSEKDLIEQLNLLGHECEVVSGNTLKLTISPNRGDCYSLYGLARDLAPFIDKEVKLPEVTQLPHADEFLTVELNESLAPAHQLLKIESYNPQPSPKDISVKLSLIGLQPKELAVDLSNIVSHELGVPLHVFDLRSIKKGLKVHLTEDKAELDLLDSTKVQLPAGTLVQSSADAVVDLAGVMGASNSALGSQSSEIAVQAAVFSRDQVRRTVSLVGKTTEAAMRYSRSVEPGLLKTALARYALLLKQYQPQAKVTAYQSLGRDGADKTVQINLDLISKLIGIPVNKELLEEIERSGFKVDTDAVVPPSWRQDIESSADIAEELVRFIGYDKLPKRPLSKQPAKVDQFEQLNQLKRELCLLGFTEVLNYSFNDRGKLRIVNASRGSEFLRESLIPGLLQATAKNNYINKLKLFESGRVFSPDEQDHLALVLSGYSESDVKSIQDQLNGQLNLKTSFQKVTSKQITRAKLKHGRVWFTELDLAQLKLPQTVSELADSPSGKWRPISKFPPVVREVTLMMNKNINHREILSSLSEAEGLLMAEHLSSYQSPKLGESVKADSFRLIFQRLDRTLTSQEADKLFESALEQLSKKFSFKLR